MRRASPSRHRAARSALLSSLVALVALCPSAHAMPPAPLTPAFFGVYTEDALGPLPDDQNAILHAQRAAGAGLIRVPFNWPSIEPTKGGFDWGPYDWLVDSTAKAGISLLPTLQNSPAWASSKPAGSDARGAFPPRNPGELGKFAAAAVRRYGPSGTFWTEHPWTPYRPLREWQVWNEPNIPYFWPTGPNPAAYTALLTATSRAIRTADPGATVVSAGITDSTMGIPQENFIAGMYRAGAKGQFDVLGVHPYAGDAHDSLALLESARRLMDDNGDSSPMWATELAWASGGEGSRFTTDEAGQAARISAFLHGAAAERAGLGLVGVIFYDWRDSVSSLPGPGAWASRSGLLRLDGSPKPGYYAFRDAARELLEPEPADQPSSPSPQAGQGATSPSAASTPSAAGPAPRSGAHAHLRLAAQRRVRVHRGGAVPLTVACAVARCAGVLRVEHGRGKAARTIARTRFSIAANTRRTLRLPLNGRGWRLIGRLHSATVRAVASGIRLEHARSLVLLPPPGWRD